MNNSFKMSKFRLFVQTRHISDVQLLKRAPGSGFFRGREKKRLLHGYYGGMQFGKLASNEHANASALILLLRST